MLVYEDFYKELGNLFYAIAANDEKISRSEKKMINSLVMYGWRPVENSTDAYGTDAANIILFQFDVNEESGADANESFQSFVSFYEDNYQYINEELQEKILSNAKNIAESTRKINNAELPMLMKLRYLISHGCLSAARK